MGILIFKMKISLRRGRYVFLNNILPLIFCALFTLLLSLIYVFTWIFCIECFRTESKKGRRKKNYNHSTEAVITGFTEERGGHRTFRYVICKYIVDNKEYELTEEIGYYDKSKTVGMKIPVYYVEANPLIASIDPKSERERNLVRAWLYVLVIILFSPTVVGFWYTLIGYVKELVEVLAQ